MTKLNRKTRLIALKAADCAERVLHYFEESRPKDRRPRKAIEAARAWANGKIRAGEARTAALAAHAAARSAEGSARAAARAAGHAAAVAHVATHARGAPMYAAKAKDPSKPLYRLRSKLIHGRAEKNKRQ